MKVYNQKSFVEELKGIRIALAKDDVNGWAGVGSWRDKFDTSQIILPSESLEIY